MNELTNSLTWIGLGIGIVAVVGILEVLLRNLTNQFGSTAYPHGLGSELNRMQKRN